MPRLQFECLESRENPTGPTIVDPIGIPVTSAPPTSDVTVVSPTPVAPNVGTDAAAIQKILQQTLAALTGGW